MQPTTQPGETMTDMPYGLCADGMGIALRALGTLGRPILITEMGCADAGDAVRTELIDTYMPVVGGDGERGTERGGIWGHQCPGWRVAVGRGSCVIIAWFWGGRGGGGGRRVRDAGGLSDVVLRASS